MALRQNQIAADIGLLITSTKSSFDQIDNTVRSFAIRLIELAARIRDRLRTYAATAMAATWSEEPQSGDRHARQRSQLIEGPKLEELSNQIHLQIRELDPKDRMRRQLASECNRLTGDLICTRWTLIEQAHSSISAPFYLVLVFWLVVVFASFGLMAPHNVLTYTTLAVGAVSIASAIFALLDFDRPFAGIFAVPSLPMHDALMQLSR